MAVKYDALLNQLYKFEDMRKEYDQFIRAFLLKMGLRALANTKKLTPVDTGNLRNRWELSDIMREGDELYLFIFNPVEYASHVEDGHRQKERFLPILYLEDSGNQQMVKNLKAKYGEDMKGIMLQTKWIPGFHMAKLAIQDIQRAIPKQFEGALKKFMATHGVK